MSNKTKVLMMELKTMLMVLSYVDPRLKDTIEHLNDIVARLERELNETKTNNL